MGKDFSSLRDYLDTSGRKRNIGKKDAAGTVSGKEADDILQTVQELKTKTTTGLVRNILMSFLGQRSNRDYS
jgi:hypothetical protein